MSGSYSNGAAQTPGGEHPHGEPAATCPRCLVCGREATTTAVMPNARRSMLIAAGACADHVEHAVRQLHDVQAQAARMKGEQ